MGTEADPSMTGLLDERAANEYAGDVYVGFGTDGDDGYDRVLSDCDGNIFYPARTDCSFATNECITLLVALARFELFVVGKGKSV